MRPRLIAGVVAALIALMLWFTHTLDAPHAALLAGVATALALAWPTDPAESPLLPPVATETRPGERRELSRLSWTSLNAAGRLTSGATDRLRAVADTDPTLASLPTLLEANPQPTPSQVIRWLDERRQP